MSKTKMQKLFFLGLISHTVLRIELANHVLYCAILIFRSELKQLFCLQRNIHMFSLQSINKIKFLSQMVIFFPSRYLMMIWNQYHFYKKWFVEEGFSEDVSLSLQSDSQNTRVCNSCLFSKLSVRFGNRIQ